MTNITLQKQHRTLWHFIPGLALSAVITGVALWGGCHSRRLRVPGSVPSPSRSCWGWFSGNTIYPHIWKKR